MNLLASLDFEGLPVGLDKHRSKRDSYSIDLQIESNEQTAIFKETLRKERELHQQHLTKMRLEFQQELATSKEDTTIKFWENIDNLRRDFKTNLVQESYTEKVTSNSIATNPFTPHPTPSTTQSSTAKMSNSRPSLKSPFTTSSPHHTHLTANPSSPFQSNMIDINNRRNIKFS